MPTLTQVTIDAFDRYIAGTEDRLESRFRGQHFVGTNETEDCGLVAINGGLIQDWVGSVFISDSSLKQVLSVVQDYEHHKDFYKPEVAGAKIRSRNGNNFQVYLRIVKAKFPLSDVLNSEHEIRFTTIDPHRVYSRPYSRRIAEVPDAGKPSEHELSVGKDRGFLWRIYGYWFFEESDGGVYVSCQSITLIRDLPFVLGKILGPIIRDLPGESVRSSLEKTRKASLALAQANR